MKTRTLECGCKQTETAWVQLCERHKAETAELHARAQREHQASRLEREARLDPLAQ